MEPIDGIWQVELDLPQVRAAEVEAWSWRQFERLLDVVGITAASRTRIQVPVTDRVTVAAARERYGAWVANIDPLYQATWSVSARNRRPSVAYAELQLETSEGRIVRVSLHAVSPDDPPLAELMPRLVVEGADALQAVYAFGEGRGFGSGSRTDYETKTGIEGGAERAGTRARGVFGRNVLTAPHVELLGGLDAARARLVDAGGQVEWDGTFLTVDVPTSTRESVELAMLPLLPPAGPRNELALMMVDFDSREVAQWVRRQGKPATPFLLLRASPQGGAAWLTTVAAAIEACGEPADFSSVSGTNLAGPSKWDLPVAEAVESFTGWYDFWRADRGDGSFVVLSCDAFGADGLLAVAPGGSVARFAEVLETFGDAIEGFGAAGTESRSFGGAAHTSGFEDALELAGPPPWPPGPYPYLCVPSSFAGPDGYETASECRHSNVLDGTALDPAGRLAAFRRLLDA